MLNANPNVNMPNATMYHLLVLGHTLVITRMHPHYDQGEQVTKGLPSGKQGFLDTKMFILVMRDACAGGYCEQSQKRVKPTVQCDTLYFELPYNPFCSKYSVA